MTCYHPLIRIEDTYKWQTAADGHKYHPAKVENTHKFLNKLETIDDHQWFERYKYGLIGCDKCIGCRLEYSRQWANRGYLEASLWQNNWFVTITYNDEHLTTLEECEDDEEITYINDGSWNGTLVPKELKLFIKNVRQIMNRDYKQTNIRYIACGEYGDENARPHYHIIFFNLNLPVEDLYKPKIIGDYNQKNVYYQSHIIERAWTKDGDKEPRGFCNVSEASWNTIAYVARYVTKKMNGKESSSHYASRGQSKEFILASNRPGIGYDYYAKHWREIYKNDEITIKNMNGVINTQPPEYFDKLLKKEHPEIYEEVKRKRRLRAKQAQKNKDLLTSITRLEQLEIEERTKADASMKLVRQFEHKLNL